MGKKRKNTSASQQPRRAAHGKPGITARISDAGASFRSSLPWKVVAGLITAAAFTYPYAMDYLNGKWGGRIALYLHSEILSQEGPTYIFFAVPEDPKDDVFIVPVELSILNDARQASKNASLSIRYDKQSDRASLPEEAMQFSGSRYGTDVTHQLNTDDQHVYSNYRITFMPPGNTMSFTDAAFASPISFGSRSPVPLSAGTGLDVMVTTYSESDRTRQWDIRYRGVKVGDNKGVQWWVQNLYGRQMAVEMRSSQGFWRYLYGWVMSKELVVYGFAPDFKRVPNSKIFMPLHNPDAYNGFKISPYVSSLLFDSL